MLLDNWMIMSADISQTMKVSNSLNWYTCCSGSLLLTYKDHCACFASKLVKIQLFLSLTLSTVWTNSADDILVIFSKLRRQDAWNVKSYSLGKIRKKYFKISTSDLFTCMLSVKQQIRLYYI